MTEYIYIRGHKLVVAECCMCETVFTMPESTHIVAKAQAGEFSFYCPHGHGQVYRSQQKITEESRIRQERDRLRQQIAQKDDEILVAKREASAAKGQITRLRNRAKAGLCSCCNRHFTNLERHMASKHADVQGVEHGSH